MMLSSFIKTLSRLSLNTHTHCAGGFMYLLPDLHRSHCVELGSIPRSQQATHLNEHQSFHLYPVDFPWPHLCLSSYFCFSSYLISVYLLSPPTCLASEVCRHVPAPLLCAAGKILLMPEARSGACCWTRSLWNT